jgi:hypothetical protein
MKHPLPVLCLLAIGIFVQPLYSLPRFALLTGSQCQSCHVDPTGGRMRNFFGFTYGKDELPIRATRDRDLDVSPKLTDNISVGADFRTQFIHDGFSETNGFQAMSATLYGALGVGKKITIYYKQDIINGTYSQSGRGNLTGTEAFGLLKILPNNSYIKAGLFYPAYGLRLDDHTSYIRGGDLGFLSGHFFNTGLPFVPNYKDIGLEVGAYLGKALATLAVLNGTGNDQSIDIGRTQAKAWAGRLEYADRLGNAGVILGGSYYNFIGLTLAGLYGGIGYDILTVSGEVDWAKDLPNYVGLRSLAAYLEANVRATEGVWIVGKFDYFDGNRKTDDQNLLVGGRPPRTNSFKRYTLGVEFFPYSFVEVRPQYRINSETPSIDNNEFLVQFHFWL